MLRVKTFNNREIYKNLWMDTLKVPLPWNSNGLKNWAVHFQDGKDMDLLLIEKKMDRRNRKQITRMDNLKKYPLMGSRIRIKICKKTIKWNKTRRFEGVARSPSIPKTIGYNIRVVSSLSEVK